MENLTDLDKLKKVFREIGVVYEINYFKKPRESYGKDKVYFDTEIHFEKEGYWKMYCDFLFLNGKFVGHGM